MRAAATIAAPLALALSVACGSSSSSSPTTYPPWPSGGIPDPGPGNQVNVAFDSVPPNDTPDTATPLGTSTTADIVVWITGNQIGGPGNASNYFVFRSGAAAGQFSFDGCFGSPITGMTAGLWKVVDAKQQLPPVATWQSTSDGAGSGCLTNAVASLDANTAYLFGLTATGGAGEYAL
jgi:hypothetical protein